MTKKRVNRNWNEREPMLPVNPATASTAFERVVLEFKLQPDEYVRSAELREWAHRNKDSRYVPEQLLKAWNFRVDSTV
jgi:hypothetical protein